MGKRRTRVQREAPTAASKWKPVVLDDVDLDEFTKEGGLEIEEIDPSLYEAPEAPAKKQKTASDDVEVPVKTKEERAAEKAAKKEKYEAKKKAELEKKKLKDIPLRKEVSDKATVGALSARKLEKNTARLEKMKQKRKLKVAQAIAAKTGQTVEEVLRIKAERAAAQQPKAAKQASDAAGAAPVTKVKEAPAAASDDKAEKKTMKQKRMERREKKAELKERLTQMKLDGIQIKKKKKCTTRKADDVEAVEPLTLNEMGAWSHFGLHKQIIENLAALRFSAPTPVQLRCIEPGVAGKDVLAAAQTGSGKTLGFCLPIVHKLLSMELKPELECLMILPTRELAFQVEKHLAAILRNTEIQCVSVVGGMSVQKQHRLLSKQPHIVIGTPGRLFALAGCQLNKDLNAEERLSKEEAVHPWLRKSIASVKFLVMDEADRLIEPGHFKELMVLLGTIYHNKKETNSHLQSFVFSATLFGEAKGRKIAGRQQEDIDKQKELMRKLKIRKDAVTVDLTSVDAQEQEVEEAETAVTFPSGVKLPETLKLLQLQAESEDDKEALLAHHLYQQFINTTEEEFRAIVFVNAISYAYRMESLLGVLMCDPRILQQKLETLPVERARALGRKLVLPEGAQAPTVVGLHANQRQKDRLHRLDKFKKSKKAILICTDLVARGLDLPHISLVVHFQVPRTSELFVHRSGRTARAGRHGQATCLLAPSEMQKWAQIMQKMPNVAEHIDVHHKDLEVAKKLVKSASEVETKAHQQRRNNKKESWFAKAAKEIDVDWSENEVDSEDDTAAREVGKLVETWNRFAGLLVNPFPSRGLQEFRKRKLTIPSQ